MQPAGPPPRTRRAASAALGLAFAALIVAPQLGRLRQPGLYGDDVLRVAQARDRPLAEVLFQPFNEHVAPLFGAVSRAAWLACGGRLGRAALAYTVAGLVPFALTLPMLGRLLRRETGSVAAARAGVAIFALSPLLVESAQWYSASSFLWALLATLAALDAAARGRAILAGLAASAAPACSAIGLLAGPLAALRAVVEPGRRRRDRLAAAAGPATGTMVYLAVGSLVRYRDVLAEGVRRHIDLRVGLPAVARAPADVLVPALAGLGNQDGRLGGGLDLALGLSLIIGIFAGAVALPRWRPLLLTGLALIVGGYGVTYGVRAEGSPHWLLEVNRYHLFPQLGLVLVLAPALRWAFGRLDARPLAARLATALLAAGLWLAHAPALRHQSQMLRCPDQARTLAALDRLADLCAREGLGRDRVRAALEPLQARRFGPGTDPFLLLAPTADSGPPLPPVEARALLLAHLSPDDREALFGGMSAAAYLGPAPASPAAVARPLGPPVVQGSRTSQDFEVPAPARFLSIPTAAPLEVWWTDDPARWTECRSLHWPAAPADSAVPLDRLPHWRADRARYLRLRTSGTGPIALEAPRLLR